MGWTEPLIGTLKIHWVEIGAVVLETTDKIRFPTTPAKAGLYQFRISRANGTFGRYVGESANLKKRFGTYRNPGPTQLTNQRLNKHFCEFLKRGEMIDVAVTTDGAWILRNNREELADLNEKNVRRLFENFVLVIGKAHEVEDFNK
jgi:hypothetical protein